MHAIKRLGGYPSLLIICLAISGTVMAESKRSLMHIPAPEVLPIGGISIATDLRGFFNYKTRETEGLPKMRTGFVLNCGIFEALEGGITLYSGDPKFHLASGQVRLLLFEEGNRMPAMAAGFMDITGARHPVEYSGYPITLSAYSNFAENKSLYFVMRKGVSTFGKAYLGIGGGRFKGHGPENSKLRGLFGGGELNLIGPVAIMGEVDGRNVNAGAGMALGMLRPGHGLDISVNASLWALYLQNMRKASADMGLSPAYSAKLDFGMTLPVIRWGQKATQVITGQTVQEAPKAEAILLKPRTIDFSKPVADWKINLVNPRGQVVRSFSGVGVMPKTIEWDGLDDRGGVVSPKAKIRMEYTVKDIDGNEKMDVVPVRMEKASTKAKPQAKKSEYGQAISLLMDKSPEAAARLKALASKPGPDGRISMYQLRATELLGYEARKAGRSAEARQYALKAGEMSRLGGLATSYKNPQKDNLWNLAGTVMGDYRLWPVLYEANMDKLANPRGMVPAGMVLRVPKEVLEEDFARCVHLFQDTPPPEDFTPSRAMGQENEYETEGDAELEIGQ